MGNQPSSQSQSSGQQPTAISTSTAQDASSSSTGPSPTPVPVSSRPIIRSRAGTGASGGANGGGTTTTTTFHSGLTPPVSPPSPPPPGTPMLLPFAGHLSPQNPHCLSHPQAHDYSKSTVTRLILEAKLAPFYRGLEDVEEDWSEDEISKILLEMREKDYEDGIENSFTEKLKEEREGNNSTVGSVAKKIGLNKQKAMRKEEEKEERVRREKRAYRFAVECPICFLNYPPNINTSRCCQQPVCTECFVQIKRSEATLTHLESDPACCPFCMETDFGVIYERPLSPLDSSSSVALATSPGSEAGASSFSQALSLGSEADLNIGPGMNPKMKETVRRKSVSSKAQEVVTIDEIRPDWEQKLNAVKAAAARKASRRIVMRQVGDRLIPIGFTSSRAPGTADFSMSVGQQSGNNEAGSRRSSRRSSNRERELEELMIEEAMRLSLMDHEDHQRKMADERRKPSVSSVSSPLNPANASAQSTSSFGGSGAFDPDSRTAPIIVTSSSGGPGPSTSSRRASNAENPTKQSGASKLLSKINHVRARASSSASSKNGKEGSGDYRSVTFASSTNGSPKPSPPSSATPSRTNTNTNTDTLQPSPSHVSPPTPAPIPVPTSKTAPPLVIPTPVHVNPHSPSQSRHISSGGLSPTSPAPVAAGPITTLASPASERTTHHHHGEYESSEHGNNVGTASVGGLPRLSLDMPALSPDQTASGGNGIKGKQPVRPTHLERMDSEMSEATVGPGNYAHLDSDEE